MLQGVFSYTPCGYLSAVQKSKPRSLVKGCFARCPALPYTSCCTPQRFLTNFCKCFLKIRFSLYRPAPCLLCSLYRILVSVSLHRNFSPSFLSPCSILPSKLVHIAAFLVQPVPGTLSNSQPVLMSSLSPHLARILDSIDSFPFPSFWFFFLPALCIFIRHFILP